MILPATMLNPTIGILSDYLNRGFRIVYWPRGADPETTWKGPTGLAAVGWNAKDREYPLQNYDPERMNVGIFTGHEIAPGKFLADVDLDWSGSLALATALLPRTDFGIGREGKVVSHCFYTTPVRFPSVKYTDTDNSTLIELRSGDSTHQTMMPPSLHPTGEVIIQRENEDISHVMDLSRHTLNLAIACILLKHLPDGLFHDARNAVAGFLLKSGLDKSDVRAIGTAICKAQGRDTGDMEHAVESANKKLTDATKRLTGKTALAKAIGEDGQGVVARIEEWLGLDEGTTKIPGKSTITKLINLAIEKAELFRDSDGDLYATVQVGDNRETLALNEKPFKSWLALEYFNTTKSGVGGGDLGSAVTTLCGAARSTGAVYPVYTRIAQIPGQGVFLDLCRDDRQVLSMTAVGWTVGPSPIRFIRREGMLPLPIPVAGRALTDILPTVVNIKTRDDLLLVIGWLVCSFRGLPPYPILVVCGEHGSSKSFMCKLVRDCIDPSKADLSLTPREDRDLLITASNSYVLGFDNLSFLPHRLSDALCSIATGAGFRTRELTTDKTETIFNAARPIVMNSIVDIARSADLLDRAIVVTLEQIDPSKRRTEADVKALFAVAQPEILAALADGVVCSLRNPVSLANLPRMADFTQTVESAGPAFSWEPGEFQKAYDTNREKSVDTLLEGDLVFAALEQLRDDGTFKEGWSGKSQALLAYVAAQTDISQEKLLPKTPQLLIGHIRRITPALRDAGITVTLPSVHRNADGKLCRDMSISFTRVSKDAEPLPFEEPSGPETRVER